MKRFWAALARFFLQIDFLERIFLRILFNFLGRIFFKVFGKTRKFLRVFLTEFWVLSRKIFGGCFLGGLLHFCWQNLGICSTIFGGVLEFFRLRGKV